METINSFILENPFASLIISAVLGGLISVLINHIYYKLQTKRITIVHETSWPIDIGKGLHSKFPNFHLVHNNNLIDEGYVQVIKGIITNNDDRDLSTTLTNHNLELILPESCHVLDVSIKKTEETEIDVEYNGNIIIFSLPENFASKNSFEYTAILKNLDDNSFEVPLNTKIPNIIVKTQKEDILKGHGLIYSGIIMMLYYLPIISLLPIFVILKKLSEDIISQLVFLDNIELRNTIMNMLEKNVNSVNNYMSIVCFIFPIILGFILILFKFYIKALSNKKMTRNFNRDVSKISSD